MAANNMVLLRSLVFIICATLSLGCVAQTKAVEQEEILKHVSLKVLKAVAEYENISGYCTDQASSSKPPKLNNDTLTSLKATRENAVLAVAFLDFRNYFLCEKEVRLKLAFELGTMESLRKELNLDLKPVQEAQSIISYPSKKELELEVKYFSLPQKVRDYFESTIGAKPFDMVETLEMNGLMRE
ncbi:MAG: hypothetical protein KTR20_04610 [Cellvibrionaceae bacterium]|nr:hypothetical protein [Cellvibrionaceae bacterium]